MTTDLVCTSLDFLTHFNHILFNSAFVLRKKSFKSILKEVIFVSKKMSSLVIKPRLKLMQDRIILVRQKRGLKAQGDVLLQAALRDICYSDCSSAKRDLQKFLQIVPDVDPEERAILENCHVQFPVQKRLKIVALLFDVISWVVMFLLKLRSKTPMGYKFTGFDIPVNI